MTTGLRLTLLCLVMLCLLLCRTQPAEFDHLLPIVGSGSWFAPHCNESRLFSSSKVRFLRLIPGSRAVIARAQRVAV
jgi:hypothetical protein